MASQSVVTYADAVALTSKRIQSLRFTYDQLQSAVVKYLQIQRCISLIHLKQKGFNIFLLWIV